MSDDKRPLIDHRPPAGSSMDDVMAGFLEAMADRGLELYAAQEEAILELFDGKNVILNTPTGSGKSLVALAFHFKTIAEGKRCFYTSPIKALVSEKFFALCDDLGAENVGMMTGDASINTSAPIICCTAEILANVALRDGDRAAVDHVVMDEFHYYSDAERGVAWQVPLLLLKRARFLLMSATLGDMTKIIEGLESTTGTKVAHVSSVTRPVPLEFTYGLTPVHETVETLVAQNKAPVYIVEFTQRGAAERAQSITSLNFATKEIKDAIKDAIGDFRFDTPYGKDMRRYIMHGLGLHHAGLLPKYRLLVEQLAQRGLLRVICGTDTLGVGVNIPIRTVLFTQLSKYDGQKTAVLSVRDFKQIGGRAGRKGFDDKGYVTAQAPEHVIENLRAENRNTANAADAKKKKKVVKKKPPDGFVGWDEQTFERLQRAEPETLSSRFEVSHGMIVNLLQGHDDGYKRLIALINSCHDADRTKSRHRRRAKTLFRSLLGAGVVEIQTSYESRARVLRVRDDLQLDFSLNQVLSLYLIETLPLLDKESETFALDVLSLVEAILENPEVILRRQVDRLKTEKMAELRASGAEYNERMAELDKIEHPKPLRDFIYDTFNAFAKKHPWVGTEAIRPKSVGREMIERFLSFHEYIKEYGLERSEGLLLRQVSQTYRTLVQNVPADLRDDRIHDVIAYFRTMLARVDTSLIEEWEEMLNPTDDATGALTTAQEPAPSDFTRDERAFRAAVRSEVHALVKSLASGDFEQAELLVRHDDEDRWTAARFETAIKEFTDEKSRLMFGADARFPDKTLLERTGPRSFRVRQTLVDPEGDNDWAIEANIALEGWSPKEPLLTIVRIGS